MFDEKEDNFWGEKSKSLKYFEGQIVHDFLIL